MKYKIIKLPCGEYVARYKSKFWWITIKGYIGELYIGPYQTKRFKTKDESFRAITRKWGTLCDMEDKKRSAKSIVVAEGEI